MGGEIFVVGLGFPYIILLIEYIFIIFLNSFNGVTFTLIGINEWLEPQISEHWPKNCPNREGVENSCLIRPGTASTFKPREGTAKAWITSVDVISRRLLVNAGRNRSFDASSNRKSEFSVFIVLSNSLMMSILLDAMGRFLVLGRI